ncbi:MAG: biliverdin-producing heme oxygenase [Kofleriaceae bacterium]
MLTAGHPTRGNESPTRDALRAATREIHVRVERRSHLGSSSLTRKAYLDALRGMLAAYTVLEDRIACHATALVECGIHWASHRKVPWLRADLATLGESTPIVSPADAPRMDTVADALGCMYVMEGATLGGAVIRRHVLQALQIGPETGARFFASYGDAVGVRWRAFCSALELGVRDEVSRQRAATSAVAAFAWIERCTTANEGE